MLWLCLFVPELPLLAAQPPPQRPFAIQGADRRLLACNALAAAAGVRSGQRPSQALALCPALLTALRRADAERRALEALAAWAGQFGSPVTLDAGRFRVWVEVGRSLRLFGGWKALSARVERALDELGLPLRRGIAPTLAGAALLARAGFSRPVLRLDRLRALIADWPVALLDLPEDAQALLAGSGLSRIGALLDVPAAALARRLGAAIPAQLARLTGAQAEAWVAYVPPPRYHRRLDLLCEIETTEGLAFPLKRLLAEFAGYLRARDAGVQRFDLRFVHAHRRPTHLPVSMLAATHDAERLLWLVRERLARRAPEAPVQEIVLEAEAFLTPEGRQSDLFDESKSQLALRDVLERLAARLGDEAIRSLAPADDHRPEHAWKACAPLPLQTAPAQQGPRRRPLWLLPAPQPIVVPKLLAGPERIESGWWEAADQRRDYFLAEDAEGRRIWVFRAPGSAQWYLHGYWN